MVTTYGPPNCTGILFQECINPFMAMPDCAVADFSPLPLTIGPNSSLATWTTGWPDGGPAYVAQPYEDHVTFRSRVIASLKAQGIGGVIIYEYARGGFFERNAAGTLLSGG
jgi:hypothetical protein